MLKLVIKNIYDLGSKLVFRFSSSVSLFIFAYLIDKLIVNEHQQSWYLEFLLIFPVVSSISRFGLPLQILSNSISNHKEVINVIKYQAILILIFSSIYLTTSNDYLLLLSICPIGSILFNYGVNKIRKGNIIGYFFQNGMIYFVMIITCFCTDWFFYNSKTIALFMITFCLIYLYKFRDIKLKLIDLKNYLSDSLNSFTIPLIIFLAFKSGNNLDVGDFLIVKSTSLISSALGGLLLLDFKKIDKKKKTIEKLDFFTSLKKRYSTFYVFLVVVVSGFIIFSYHKKIYLLIILILFETFYFFIGQQNLLNIYFNNQNGIIKSNLLSIVVTSLGFAVLMIFNFKYHEIVLYILGTASFQYFSYINLKKYQNL